MEKEQKQELGWRVSVLPIPAFHHCEPLCTYVLHVLSVQWNAGMGNTDTLHPNSCFPSLYVTRYGILDHMLFFSKIDFFVSIDAQFIVESNRARSVKK